MHFLLTALLCVGSLMAYAQTVTVRGQLVDAETGEPLIGASVLIEGTKQGSVTDVDGNFTQNAPHGATLVFSYVGYKEHRYTLDRDEKDLGVIRMQPDAVMLQDVVVTSTRAIDRKTPVAVSTIGPAFIEEKLGTQEFPEVLKSTPGVYVTKDGGGYGDANTRVRGFESENVAVMINGVPMNGMENQRYIGATGQA